MQFWTCILLSLASAGTEAHSYPTLVARCTGSQTPANVPYVSCAVQSAAFGEFIAEQVALEYHAADDLVFDALEFTAPISPRKSIEKIEFYLEKQLCMSLSYVMFAGSAVLEKDAYANVSCKNTYGKGVFSINLAFTDGARSSRKITVRMYWNQRPTAFCNIDGALEKHYVFPRQKYYKHVTSVRRHLSGLLGRVAGNCSFTFTMDTQNMQGWSVDILDKHTPEGSAYHITSPDTDKDIVCIFTAKEGRDRLSVRQFTFQNHRVLEVSAAFLASARAGHAACPREVVFVVDMSKHMVRCKRTVLLEALERLISTVAGLDVYVNIVFFKQNAEAIAGRSIRVSDACDIRSIKEKLELMFRPDREGEQNVLSGLEKAMALERVQKDGELLERNVILITSGINRNLDEVRDLVQEEAGNGVRFFAVGIGRVASHDVLGEITRLGRGAYNFIKKVRDTGHCLSIMLERTGSPGYEYDCGPLDVDSRGIASFIVEGCLNVGERPVQVPSKEHAPIAFACEGLKIYLVFRHRVPEQVELALGGAKYTCRRDSFSVCENTPAERELVNEFMRHVNREFYLLASKVYHHSMSQGCCDREDGGRCLITLTNIIEGDALLVDHLDILQKDKLAKFAERYSREHSIYNQSLCVGTSYFDFRHRCDMLMELLRTFESEMGLEEAIKSMHSLLQRCGIDTSAVVKFVQRCRETAKKKGLARDTDIKRLFLAEAAALFLRPLDRESASVVSHKNNALRLGLAQSRIW